MVLQKSQKLKKLKKLRVRKARDHNHATGEYRGAAHASCNINKKQVKHIPVFFHNLRGYDGHLIMRGIHRHSGKKLNKKNKAENRCKNIRVLPNNMEWYVSFQLGNLRFLDSIQFFGPGSSLDTLASREFKQIATATSTMAVVDAVSWGEFVS